MNQQFANLLWAATVLKHLPMFPWNYEIVGGTARRVGSVYSTMPCPANDVRFTMVDHERR